MPGFSGFPYGTQYTPVPNLFFSSVLPQISDVAELKIVLHVFWTLHRKKEYPRFVTFDELRSDVTLMSGIVHSHSNGEEALEEGLNSAISRGLLLPLELEHKGSLKRLYFLNSEADREALEKLRRGEVRLGDYQLKEPALVNETSDIFSLYEENIGVITPLVAERLKQAETLYSSSWISEAMQEAVVHNSRSWSYIEAILRRWESEGKSVGENRRHPRKDEDTQKYFRDRFGNPTGRVRR